MGNVLNFGFQKPELHWAAQRQLRRLSEQTRIELLKTLDVIGREGGYRLPEHVLISRETPFLDEIQRVAMFKAGRGLGILEIFRRNIMLVGVIDLDLLNTRVKNAFSTVWARSEIRDRPGGSFVWSAFISIMPDNRLCYAQNIESTLVRGRYDRDGRRIDHRYGRKSRHRGCFIMDMDPAPYANDAECVPYAAPGKDAAKAGV